ncbi:MAG: hypothetical protein ACIAQU_02310 [Phycisphaerales bacterium JB064]
MRDATHWWRIRAKLPERYGQACVVEARGRMNSVLVRFADGHRVITSAWSVRKLPRPGDRGCMGMS